MKKKNVVKIFFIFLIILVLFFGIYNLKFKNNDIIEQKISLSEEKKEEGKYTSDTLIDCEGGSWYQAGKRVRDDHPQKILSLAGVIQHSSNIGIAKVALDLGAKEVLSKLLDLGFGVKPPMDFFNMPRGLLRNPVTIKPIELIKFAITPT